MGNIIQLNELHNYTNQITLVFDGTLAPNHSVSLRTLSYTIPHFQRAVDKTVYFQQRGEIRKYTTLPVELHHMADLYLNELEEGSLRLPFLSDLLKEVPALFKNFLAEPYERAANEVHGYTGILKTDLESSKINVTHDNLDHTTQSDLVKKHSEYKRDQAQASVMKDISTALSVVRSTNGGIMSFNVDSPSGAAEYEFDQLRASRFAKLATTKRLADPALYIGRITGLEKQRGNKQFEYSAKFLSSLTKQENKIHIADYDDASKLHSYNLASKDVVFWAAPISMYDAFDPVRGDLVFVDLARDI